MHYPVAQERQGARAVVPPMATQGKIMILFLLNLDNAFLDAL